MQDEERALMNSEANLFAAMFLNDFGDFEPDHNGDIRLERKHLIGRERSGNVQNLADQLMSKLEGEPNAQASLEYALGQTLNEIMKEAMKYQLMLSSGKDAQNAAREATLATRLARRLKMVKARHAMVLAETSIVAPEVLPHPSDGDNADNDRAKLEAAKLDYEGAFKQAYLDGLRHQLLLDRERLQQMEGTDSALKNRLAAKLRAAETLLEEQLAGNKAALFTEHFVDSQAVSIIVGGAAAPPVDEQDLDIEGALRKAKLEALRHKLAVDREQLERRQGLSAKLKSRLAAQIDAAESRLIADETNFNAQKPGHSLALDVALKAAFAEGTRQQVSFSELSQEDRVSIEQKLVAAAKTDLVFVAPASAVRVAQETAGDVHSNAPKMQAMPTNEANAFKAGVKASFLEGLRTHGEEDDKSDMEAQLRKARLVDLRRQLALDRRQLERAAGTDAQLKNRLLAQIKEAEVEEADVEVAVSLEEAKMQIAEDKAEAFAAQFLEVFAEPGAIVSFGTPAGNSPQQATNVAAAKEATMKSAMNAAMRAAFQQGTRQTLAWNREESHQRAANQAKVHDRLAARLAAVNRSAVKAAKAAAPAKAAAAAKAKEEKQANATRKASSLMLPRTSVSRRISSFGSSLPPMRGRGRGAGRGGGPGNFMQRVPVHTTSGIEREFADDQRLFAARQAAGREARERKLARKLNQTKNGSGDVRVSQLAANLVANSEEEQIQAAAEIEWARQKAEEHRKARLAQAKPMKQAVSAVAADHNGMQHAMRFSSAGIGNGRPTSRPVDPFAPERLSSQSHENDFRGMCAQCGKAVTIRHQRDKDAAGNYFHSNPADCNAQETNA
jgi:hypothetical protein